ncbi:MAG: 3-methyl-2-oxobutanoate hydroxymethyltransferase [Phycisphaerales bacterium JB037]
MSPAASGDGPDRDAVDAAAAARRDEARSHASGSPGEHLPAPGDAPPEAKLEPVTLRTLNRMARRGEKFACLTAYDATTARWLERAGVHLLLAGDSAAEVIFGLDRTIDVPVEALLALTAAVKRGAPRTVVMADLPFMTYHTGVGEAVRSAGRFLTEGLADIVKVEADASFAPEVRAMSRAGIAVCAHVGSKPQHSTRTGGYTSAGRTAAGAARIIEDARALEEAGAVMLLVEAVPEEVAARLVERTSVPVIGIGAGPACHGQILVIQDLLGMTDHPPRFAEPVASMGPAIREAGREWVRRVASGSIGGQRYAMQPGEDQKLTEMGPRRVPEGERAGANETERSRPETAPRPARTEEG